MPRLVNARPKYRRHSSGQAFVVLSGKKLYLGAHGTPESYAEYSRALAEWEAAGRGALPRSGPPAGLTVTELIARFWKWAEGYYPSNGDLKNLRDAVRALKATHAYAEVNSFGPLALQAIQQSLVKEGKLARPTVNARVNRIRRIFKWGVAQQLVSPDVLTALQAVAALKRGRSEAREPAPVGPVADAIVDATLPHLPWPIADMVRLQKFTGMRSGELVTMRTCDVNTAEKTWVYTPATHKTAYRGRARKVSIGKEARPILARYLRPDLGEYLFSPARAAEARYKRMRAKRVTPVQPSQKCRRKAKPKKKPGAHYTTQSYYRAVVNAIRKHEVAHWTPHRLRHTVGTLLRKRFGLESSAAALGHATLAANQVYSERDEALAVAAMEAVG